jgi:hypothetical protein
MITRESPIELVFDINVFATEGTKYPQDQYNISYLISIIQLYGEEINC